MTDVIKSASLAIDMLTGGNSWGTYVNGGDPSLISFPGLPEMVQAVDAKEAVASVWFGDASGVLKCSNFGFDIPLNATINSVTVYLTHRQDNTPGGLLDNPAVCVLPSGEFAVTTNNVGLGSPVPLTQTREEYYATHEGWGFEDGIITPSQVNSTLAVAIKTGEISFESGVDYYVNMVEVEIGYEVPVSGSSPNYTTPPGVGAPKRQSRKGFIAIHNVR